MTEYKFDPKKPGITPEIFEQHQRNRARMLAEHPLKYSMNELRTRSHAKKKEWNELALCLAADHVAAHFINEPLAPPIKPSFESYPDRLKGWLYETVAKAIDGNNNGPDPRDPQTSHRLAELQFTLAYLHITGPQFASIVAEPVRPLWRKGKGKNKDGYAPAVKQLFYRERAALNALIPERIVALKALLAATHAAEVMSRQTMADVKDETVNESAALAERLMRHVVEATGEPWRGLFGSSR